MYLLGRRFTIQTDHRALEWLQNSREKNRRLTCWSLALQPYDFHIVYRKGPENGNADAQGYERKTTVPTGGPLNKRQRNKHGKGIARNQPHPVAENTDLREVG